MKPRPRLRTALWIDLAARRLRPGCGSLAEDRAGALGQGRCCCFPAAPTPRLRLARQLPCDRVLPGLLEPRRVHLETNSRFFAPIEPGTEVVAGATVADLFEKRGHAFVDLDVNAYGDPDDAARAAVRLRAIYRLRAAEREPLRH